VTVAVPPLKISALLLVVGTTPPLQLPPLDQSPVVVFVQVSSALAGGEDKSKSAAAARPKSLTAGDRGTERKRLSRVVARIGFSPK
jgi:hypothetical protein